MNKSNLVKYLFFILVFVGVSLWIQLFLSFSSLKQNNSLIEVIQNQNLQNLILQKTGVNIQSIKLSSSSKLFGMMIGIPGFPQLILTKSLYENFSSSEIEYVVLHETGHYVLWHSVTELVLGLFFLGLGIIIIKKINGRYLSLIMALILGFVLGVIMIKFGRIHEYQADDYALERISDPRGMIQATKKFKNAANNSIGPKNKLLEFWFYRSVPYAERIEKAKLEINQRK